ncbi:hypothetical protein NG796_00805 [Laspinema sp. A4]|uniref:hypothetical protein n=1 Tax=Laspinema sp. D2d TaxID=2953686 RepID=UPI0021BAB94E|nr:hypothetical protein [Laspinema sp. D2d]MCT7981824.1 hypothetical protein [Laspinema sp. D2d]
MFGLSLHGLQLGRSQFCRGDRPNCNFLRGVPSERSLLATLGDKMEESQAKPLAALGDRREERAKPRAIAIGSSGSQTRGKYHANFLG